jgi:dipeptidyl aminopeptidase/acylaminoacyl peptidase
MRPFFHVSLAPIGFCSALVLSASLAWAAGPPPKPKAPKAMTTITPNENLVVEGIPKISANLVERVDRYTQFRSASIASWHPTRREMLISTRFGDVAQVHGVKFPLGARRQLTFFPERVSGASFQPKHGDYFVFSKDIGGNEFSQNYRYDVASGETTLLTDGTSKNSKGVWSHSGSRIAYTSTRRTGVDTDIYMVDPLKPEGDRLVAQVRGGGWGVLDWAVDDKSLLAIEYVSVNESYLWRVDLATGQKTLLTQKTLETQKTLGTQKTVGTQRTGPKVSYQGAVFSPDGRGMYVVTDQGAEFSRLAYVDLATMQPRYLTSNIPWDVEEFELSDDGQHLAFVVNQDGASVLHVLETSTGKEIRLPKLPLGLVLGITWRRNGEELGFTLTSAKSTADVYSLNIKTGMIDRWTESETGGLNTENFSDAQLVRWPSFDGRQISGFLYQPPAKFSGKRPVIIDIHGGPEGQSRPYFLGRMNYYLNELGVAVIFPNVRGSVGYGKTFLQLDNGYLREDSVKDIGALLDWIKTQPDLDSDRILVTGGSYGGYMSLAVATNYGDRIRGAIDIVGISNFVTFLERTEGYRRDLRRVEYGDERDPKMRAFLEKISPLTNAGKIKKPLFVIHGKNDPRVPLNEAEQMVKVVRGNGVPVWYLMATDEGHGFSKKKNVDFQFYATVEFIQTVLLK